MDYTAVFENFNKLRILIVGDVMVDSYLWGEVDRISPEAPVPVVAVKRRADRLGGAANVALNVKALGATPVLCSVIGNDLKGEEFIRLMNGESIPAEGIIQSSHRITTTKFRVFGNNTQMLRVDEEITSDLNPDDAGVLRDTIHDIVENEKIDAIVFQDYDKGVLTRELISDIIELAGNKSIPVAVDPKRNNFSSYHNVDLFKPNLKELKDGLNIEINQDNVWELENAANILHRDRAIRIVFTTLSEAGVFVSALNTDKKIERHSIPACIRSIADVSGAGDTVISVASLCLAAGMTPYQIAAVSNLAGGLVCEEVGVVPVNKEKLMKEVLTL